jgi:hypothetical protein
MEEISKKKKVLSELVSQSHLNAQDYELDFSMHDVKAGKEDATLIIKKLHGLIMKLKKELKLRKDIIDGAEKILNTRSEEIQLLSFRSEIGGKIQILFVHLLALLVQSHALLIFPEIFGGPYFYIYLFEHYLGAVELSLIMGSHFRYSSSQFLSYLNCLTNMNVLLLSNCDKNKVSE